MRCTVMVDPGKVNVPPRLLCACMFVSYKLQVRTSHLSKATVKALEPRKTPVQARSAASVEAILQATIQVLLKDGKLKLTTTRVAHRAGVSVGTLYQYSPNKSALLQALLKAH